MVWSRSLETGVNGGQQAPAKQGIWGVLVIVVVVVNINSGIDCQRGLVFWRSEGDSIVVSSESLGELEKNSAAARNESEGGYTTRKQ
jgi:hypothetical protein